MKHHACKPIIVYHNRLYNPHQSIGAETITTLTRNQVQVRKAYFLLGDKSMSPLYFSKGKQDLPFGLLDTVSPLTASIVWHAFGTLAYSTLLDVDISGLNLSAVTVQDGSQFRAANVPVNNINVSSRINNFVVDVNYTYKHSEDQTIMLGSSYIYGSAYNQEFPVVSFGVVKNRNPAFDVFSQIILYDITLQDEVVRTTKKLSDTHIHLTSKEYNPSKQGTIL